MNTLYILLLVIFLIILIKLKFDLWVVFLSGAFLVAFLFRMKPATFMHSFFTGGFSIKTLRVTGIVYLVLLLASEFKELGVLELLAKGIQKIIPNRFFSIAVPPAIIGLLPMPGGALVSAPIVDEVTKNTLLNPEEKTFLNFWFRHIWEYFWPLYPGLIVASAVLGIPILKISGFQYPMTIFAVTIGILWSMRIVNIKKSTGENFNARYAGILLLTFSPIGLVIILSTILKWDIFYSMLLTCFILVIYAYFRKFSLKKILKGSFIYKTILLIITVMIFKQVLLDSSALKLSIPQGNPYVYKLFILFIVPFFVGLLTGVNQAYVAISFPLLLPFINLHSPNMVYILVAYTSGFAGVLLSPAHLCLILTRDYFKAKFSGVYKLLIPPVFIVYLLMLLYLWGRRYLGG